MNKVFALARGQSTLDKWCSMKSVVTTHSPSSEKRTTLSLKHSSGPQYVSLAAIELNAYFHLKQLRFSK